MSIRLDEAPMQRIERLLLDSAKASLEANGREGKTGH